jgi:hypothetical protein
LEFDTAVSFSYCFNEDETSVSGFGDAEVALKWRFLGDGDGPFNLGLEAIALLPSGETQKGLSEDDIIPTAFFFGTVGHESVRLLLNAGMTWYPEANDAMLYGAALEWAAHEQWTLVGEVYGESDLEDGGENDPLEAIVGALYSPEDWLTLSGGVSFGLNDDAPDYRASVAVLVGW